LRRAPVIDLVVLDPHNPRSIVYQLDCIESHLAALAKLAEEGRLSPPSNRGCSGDRVRTSAASKVDDALIVASEEALMKLSELIASTYLTLSERSETMWEHWHDLRHPPDHLVQLRFPGRLRRPCAAAHPVNRSGQRVYAAASTSSRARMSGARALTLRNHIRGSLSRSRTRAHHQGAARIAVETPADVAELETPRWRICVRRGGDTGYRCEFTAHFLFPSRMVSLDPDTRDYAEGSFSADSRCWPRARSDASDQGRLRV